MHMLLYSQYYQFKMHSVSLNDIYNSMNPPNLIAASLEIKEKSNLPKLTAC